jgi:protein arginine kinase activator
MLSSFCGLITEMLCDGCKCNDAAVFLSQILEGKMQKVNLCDACSKEKGVQDPTGFALADLLLGIGAAEEIEKGAIAQKCPICGFTQTDFKKTGRLGCSACYHTFAEGLSSLLKAMHKGTEHVGKLPQRAHREIELNDRMRALNEDLQKAVAEENYETAASLRDQIKQLENKIAS